MSYVDAVEPNQYAPPPAPSYSAPAPPPPPAAPAPPVAPDRASSGTRIGLVVLIAVLLEFVVIAAGDNQWVADKITRDTTASFTDRILESSWLTYNWRFTHGVYSTAQWGGQLLLVLTTFVVTAALVFVLLRGPVTWARAFFGTWLAVVFASLVGAFVRGLVAPDPAFMLPGANRLMRSVFGTSGPSVRVVAVSVVLGAIVALVTSIVAVSTRRAPSVPGDGVGTGAPTFPDYAPPPAAQPSAPPPWQDRVDQQTTRLPAPAGPSPSAPQANPFPRPPDDEDLGHVGH